MKLINKDRPDPSGRGEGGEGGSWSSSFLTSPTLLSETLTPTGLLTVSLILSAMLVGLITVALG